MRVFIPARSIAGLYARALDCGSLLMPRDCETLFPRIIAGLYSRGLLRDFIPADYCETLFGVGRWRYSVPVAGFQRASACDGGSKHRLVRASAHETRTHRHRALRWSNMHPLRSQAIPADASARFPASGGRGRMHEREARTRARALPASPRAPSASKSSKCMERETKKNGEAPIGEEGE